MLDKPSDFITKGRLKEFKGDVSVPVSAGNRFIIVPVKADGTSDGGTVFQKWAAAKRDYRTWYVNSYGGLKLGQAKTVQVQSDTVIASITCLNAEDEIDYKALQSSLDAVGKEASGSSGASIHIPKFGEWDKVEAALDAVILKRGLNINVYSVDEQ